MIIRREYSTVSHRLVRPADWKGCCASCLVSDASLRISYVSFLNTEARGGREVFLRLSDSVTLPTRYHVIARAFQALGHVRFDYTLCWTGRMGAAQLTRFCKGHQPTQFIQRPNPLGCYDAHSSAAERLDLPSLLPPSFADDSTFIRRTGAPERSASIIVAPLPLRKIKRQSSRRNGLGRHQGVLRCRQGCGKWWGGGSGHHRPVFSQKVFWLAPKLALVTYVCCGGGEGRGNRACVHLISC